MPGAGARRRSNQEDNVLSLAELAVPSRPADRSRPMTAETDSVPQGDTLLAHVLKSLDDDQALDIVEIDLRGKSEIADYMIVCSGRSSRQVVSISDKLTERLKRDHGIVSKVEGKDGGDWVLIDAGDVIVHVFRPEVRDYYQLEKMWLSPAQAAARF
jgi:ribosome-associated protein